MNDVEILDDSGAQQEVLHRLTDEQIEELESQLPEGWTIQRLGDDQCPNCGGTEFEHDSAPRRWTLPPRRLYWSICKTCGHTETTEEIG